MNVERERLLAWVSRPLYRAAVATVLIAYLVVFPGWYPDNYVVLGQNGLNVTVAPFSVNVSYQGPVIPNASSILSSTIKVGHPFSFSMCTLSLRDAELYNDVGGLVGATPGSSAWSSWWGTEYDISAEVPASFKNPWWGVIFKTGLHYVEIVGKRIDSEGNWAYYLENDLGDVGKMYDHARINGTDYMDLYGAIHGGGVVNLPYAGVVRVPGWVWMYSDFTRKNVTVRSALDEFYGELVIVGAPGLKLSVALVKGDNILNFSAVPLRGDCHVVDDVTIVLDPPNVTSSSTTSTSTSITTSGGMNVTISPPVDARDNYLIVYKSGEDYYISLKGLAKLYSMFWIAIIVFWVYRGWGVSV